MKVAGALRDPKLRVTECRGYYDPPPTVLKLGGSLLDLPDLAERVRRLLALRRDAPALIVVGGGPTADVVRAWDRIHQLGEEAAHWLALESLRLNERLVARLLPEASVVSDRPAARDAWNSGRIPVLCAVDFVRGEEPRAALEVDGDEWLPSGPLPHCWDVTSDSVAAWIALRWPARELLLAKSIDAGPAPHDANSSDVDPYFARLAAALPQIGWVNLRADDPKIILLPPGRFHHAGR